MYIVYFLDVTVTVEGKPCLSHPTFILHNKVVHEILYFCLQPGGPKCAFSILSKLCHYSYGFIHKQLDLLFLLKTWHDSTELFLDRLLFIVRGPNDECGLQKYSLRCCWTMSEGERTSAKWLGPISPSTLREMWAFDAFSSYIMFLTDFRPAPYLLFVTSCITKFHIDP